jgi:hypothetical protein
VDEDEERDGDKDEDEVDGGAKRRSLKVGVLLPSFLSELGRQSHLLLTTVLAAF